MRGTEGAPRLTHSLMLYLIFLTSASCREQWDVIAESAEQVTFFLASKMSVALPPPFAPPGVHKQSLGMTKWFWTVRY